MPETFSRRLETAFAKHGQLCVGIDPHAELLEDNGFSDSVEGLLNFSLNMLEQLEGVVGIIKPQISFYERFGSQGFAVLERILTEANQRGFLVIADAKRGDIGSTMRAYGQAWLDKDAPFICDALTVNPYLGVGALKPAVVMAAERGKGLFVLAATSNPEAIRVQSSISEDQTLTKLIAEEVSALNISVAPSKSRFGTLGLVIGATVDLAQLGISDYRSAKPEPVSAILAPGFGYQGAQLKDAKSLFGANADNVIYSISRSALRSTMAGVRSTVSSDAQELAQALAD